MYNKLNPNAVGLHNHSTGEKILTLLNKNKFGYIIYIVLLCGIKSSNTGTGTLNIYYK
jgi:hypothetical protein